MPKSWIEIFALLAILLVGIIIVLVFVSLICRGNAACFLPIALLS